jgi:hypothetical protein
MFMEQDLAAPPPAMTEGAYWLFMPVGVLLATPVAAFVAGAWFDQTLAPALSPAVEGYRAFLGDVERVSDAVWSAVVPTAWQDQVPRAPVEVAVASFAGGAFVASWFAAAFQRQLGLVGGFVAALIVMLLLGGRCSGSRLLSSLSSCCAIGLSKRFRWRAIARCRSCCLFCCRCLAPRCCSDSMR